MTGQNDIDGKSGEQEATTQQSPAPAASGSHPDNKLDKTYASLIDKCQQSLRQEELNTKQQPPATAAAAGSGNPIDNPIDNTIINAQCKNLDNLKHELDELDTLNEKIPSIINMLQEYSLYLDKEKAEKTKEDLEKVMELMKQALNDVSNNIKKGEKELAVDQEMGLIFIRLGMILIQMLEFILTPFLAIARAVSVEAKESIDRASKTISDIDKELTEEECSGLRYTEGAKKYWSVYYKLDNLSSNIAQYNSLFPGSNDDKGDNASKELPSTPSSSSATSGKQ